MLRVIFAAVVLALSLAGSSAVAQPLNQSSTRVEGLPQPADHPMTRNGAFVSRLAIDSPPARHGMKPAPYLAYSSQNANGLAGVGWALRGLPAITRMSFGFGIRYNGQDTYAWLPGGLGEGADPDQRLVTKTGNLYHLSRQDAGAPLTEFEAFGRCGDGPCYFIARDGAGIRYYLGGDGTTTRATAPAVWEPDNGTTSARGIFAWALYRVEDVHGNYYTVTYYRNAWTLWPREIRYTLHSFSPIPRHNRIVFEYGTRPDMTPMPHRLDQRLTDVLVYGACSANVACTLVRRYRLSYELSPASGRSRLISFGEIGADNISALPTRTFAWTDGGLNVSGIHPLGPLQEHPYDLIQLGVIHTAFESPVSGQQAVWSAHACDINGDGRDDVIRVFQGPTDFNGTQSYDYATIVQYALSYGEGLGEPVTHTFQFPGGHSRYWKSLCGDVNGDGFDDLVLFMFADTGMRAQLALGGAGSPSLAALTDWSHNFDWGQTQAWNWWSNWDAALADVNGDQKLDLVAFNHYARKFAYALGESGGLGAFVSLPSRLNVGVLCLDDSGDPNCLWYRGMLVRDFNGDGLSDVLAAWTTSMHSDSHNNRSGFIRWSYAFGDLSDPLSVNGLRLQPVGSINPGYDLVAGDINGDGHIDALLGRTGPQGTIPSCQTARCWTIEGQSFPFGRELRTLFGDRLGGSFVDRVIEDSGIVYPAMTPENRAQTNHLLADINGDGIADSLNVYRGALGTRVDYQLLTPTGSFGNTSVAQDPNVVIADSTARQDGNWDQVWRSATADVNGDGNQDLILVYHGRRGIELEYALGNSSNAFVSAASNLLPIEPWCALPACPPDFGTILFPDINGDGRQDILFVPQFDNLQPPAGRIHYALSIPGQPDLLRQIRNGYGGTTEIEYTTPASGDRAVAQAIDRQGRCQGATGLISGAACGASNRAPRNLVARVTTNNGRGFITSTRFEYRNGRVLPGTFTTRTDLGFAEVRRTVEQTGATDATIFRQDPPFEGQVAEELSFAEGCGLSWPCGLQTMAVVRWTYDVLRPYRKITAVRTASRHEERREFGQRVSWVRVTYTHDPVYLVPTEALSCSSEADPCIRTRNAYTHDPDGQIFRLGRWIIGRLDATWTTRATAPPEKMVDALRTFYDPARGVNQVRRERLLFTDAELAQCKDIGDPGHFQETCAAEVRAGIARWVPIQQNLQHDDYGNLIASEDANRNRTQWTYDPDHQAYEASEQNALGQVTLSLYDSAGRRFAVRDANNQQTTTYFDAFGRPSRVAPPGITTPEVERRSYDDFGTIARQRLKVTRYPSPMQSHEIESYFDGFGEVYAIADHSGIGLINTRDERTYSAEGQLIIRRSLPYFPGDTVHWIETRYDWAGRPAVINRVDENFHQLKELARYTYHVDGSVTVRDATFRTERRYTDARGRLVRIADASGQLTTLSYDPAGRVKQVTLPPGQTGSLVEYGHDTLGRRTSFSDAASGQIKFEYDDVNNLLVKTDTAGVRVTYTYDKLDRLKTEAGSSLIGSYDYDQPGHGQSAGRLTSVSDRSGSTSLHYDQRGNIIRRDISVGLPQVYTYLYGVNQLNRVTSKRFPVGLPDEAQQEFVQTPDGILLEVRHNGVIFARYSQHNANRQVGQQEWRIDPVTQQASDVTVFTYNADQLLNTLITTDRTGAALQNYLYGYDGVGNLLSLQDRRVGKIVGNVNTDESQTFTYDPLSRLSTAQGLYGFRSYDYDPLGNITRNGGVAMTYSRCGTGQCIGGSVAAASGAHLWDATHDEAGKRTRFVTLNPPITWDYGYDERQQLTQVWWNGALREENAYNYAGDRARKVYYDAGGLTTTTYYVGDSYELRINSLNPHAVASTHRVAGLATVTAGNRIFGQASEAATLAGRSSPLGGSTITGSSQGTWLHLGDHLGSAAVTAQGGSGSAVERLAHEPFGGLLRANSIGVDGHTHKFAGQELDEESGLLKSGARYYDSVTARFMTADSLLPIADRGAQYYNRFSYVLNNPLRFVDPSGHFEEELQALKLGALRQILVIGGHVALLFETTDQGTYDRTIAAYDKRLAELDHPFWQEVGENIVVQLATPPIPGGEIEVPEGTKFLWAKKPPIVVEPAITGENPTVGVEKGPTDTRVKLRKYVREEIEQNQPRNEAGEKIDPNTRQSLKEGEIDVGHKHGQEWRVRKEMHKQRGSTRKEVIETENDSDLYELQDRSENRSHRHEKKP